MTGTLDPPLPAALAPARDPAATSPTTAAPDRSPAGGRASVCLYTPSVDPSGMGEHMLELVRAYAPRADVSVLCRPTEPGCRLLDRAAALGATAVPLPPPRDAAFAGTIAGFLRSRPTDVFHSHVGIGWENWDAARAARAAGVGAVVQTQHLPFSLSHPRKREGFLRAAADLDRLIAVSAGVRRSYERIGVPSGRFTTVWNGISPRTHAHGRLRARRMLGLGAHQRVVLTVGRLTHMKGHRHLVDAVPELVTRFPDLAVVLLGQGPLRAELARRAEQRGVGCAVRLAGHRHDARALLDAADVFVLPSRHEGMPLAALEAMDAGLPVVATDVVGTQDVVAHGRTGLLVPADDACALAAALATLLADPRLAAAFGAAGRRRYRRWFTAERMAAETFGVYLQALGAPTLPVLRPQG